MPQQEYHHIFIADQNGTVTGEHKLAYQDYDISCDEVSRKLAASGISDEDAHMGFTSMCVSQLVYAMGKENAADNLELIAQSLRSEPCGTGVTFELDEKSKNKLN
jgi:hypothetical protein